MRVVVKLNDGMGGCLKRHAAAAAADLLSWFARCFVRCRLWVRGYCILEELEENSLRRRRTFTFAMIDYTMKINHAIKIVARIEVSTWIIGFQKDYI